MITPDPRSVQAVAEALHADQCPDDECVGGDMGEYERMAEIAIAAARPLIAAEAWDEAAQALAWLHDNGPKDAAPAYLRDNNPYRTEQEGQ